MKSSFCRLPKMRTSTQLSGEQFDTMIRRDFCLSPSTRYLSAATYNSWQNILSRASSTLSSASRCSNATIVAAPLNSPKKLVAGCRWHQVVVQSSLNVTSDVGAQLRGVLLALFGVLFDLFGTLLGQILRILTHVRSDRFFNYLRNLPLDDGSKTAVTTETEPGLP